MSPRWPASESSESEAASSQYARGRHGGKALYRAQHPLGTQRERERVGGLGYGLGWYDELWWIMMNYDELWWYVIWIHLVCCEYLGGKLFINLVRIYSNHLMNIMTCNAYNILIIFDPPYFVNFDSDAYHLGILAGCHRAPGPCALTSLAS
jgi:hypothetical protein